MKKIKALYADTHDNYIYALSDYIPYIFVIDEISGEIINKIMCPKEEGIASQLYSGIYYKNNSIILIPMKAKYLWIYNLVTSLWKGIDLSEYLSPELDSKFMGGKVVFEECFLFGYAFKGILAVNIVTYEIKEIKVSDYIFKGGLKGISSVYINDCVYVPARTEDVIICIDTISFMAKVVKSNLDSKIPNDGISFGGECFYILKNSGNFFYRIKKDFSTTEKIELINMNNENNGSYEGVEYFNNYIIFFGEEKKAYLYNISEMTGAYVFEEPISYAKRINATKLLICKKNIICMIDDKFNITREYNIELDEDEVKCYLHVEGRQNILYSENELVGFEEFLGVLSE